MANNTAAAIATLRGLTAKFDTGVRTATPFYPQLAQIISSAGSDERYAFLGAMPRVKEWLGDRQFEKLRASEYTLKNRLWESSLEIEKTDVRDDRLGMYGPTLEMLGQEAAIHPDVLLFELLVLAESQAGWDGQYFFDTDHSFGESGSQSNDISYDAVSTSAVTAAEFLAAYHAARKAMLNFKKDNGDFWIPNTVKPFNNLLIVVGPDLELAARTAISQLYLANGASNVVLDQNAVRIEVSPRITDGTKFYLFNLGQPLKPFIFQAREPLSRQMKGMDDDEFKNVKFMTQARYNLGYGAWWNAVLTTFT